MALEDEQSDFLSKLNTGQAIVFSGGFNKAVAVKIAQSSNTTDEIVDKDKIKHAALEFYMHNAKSGILIGSDVIKSPKIEDISMLFMLQKEGVKELVRDLKENYIDIEKSLYEKLKSFIDNGVDMDILVKIFMVENSISKEYVNETKEFLEKYLNKSFESRDRIKFRDVFL